MSSHDPTRGCILLPKKEDGFLEISLTPDSLISDTIQNKQKYEYEWVSNLNIWMLSIPQESTQSAHSFKNDYTNR